VCVFIKVVKMLNGKEIEHCSTTNTNRGKLAIDLMKQKVGRLQITPDSHIMDPS
jgi:hypothetical protein